MDDPTFLAMQYLVPQPDAFWRWDDQAEVLTWQDNTTIAFRTELEQVLDRLAPYGLPPLDAIVLLLAATRDSWSVKNAPSRTTIDIAGLPKTAQFIVDLRNETLTGLNRVHDLPVSLRSTPDARAEITDMVFSSSKSRGHPEIAKAALRLLSDGLGTQGRRRIFSVTSNNVREPTHSSISNSPNGDWMWQIEPHELTILRDGLKNVDAAALASRLKTGLEDTVLLADVMLPPGKQVRKLLAELERDEELCGLARLARNVMAAVSLPRALADRDDMPLGGVSDISNRGPLDRLLLSELAYDDTTLAVRVACNEALYLRREQPPRTPPRQRTIVLDAGLRMWGVPRVYATAVALALTATAEAGMNVVAYRMSGNSVIPLNLCTRAGVIAHLEALEMDAHPGDGLPALRTALASAATGSDLVVITGEDVVADRDFQKALTASELLPAFVASVARDGRLELLHRTAQGSKLMRSAKLHLDELFEKPPRVALIDPSRNRDLPAIFSVRPFPLLLSHPLVPANSWNVEGVGILSVTNDRRLMLWDDDKHGARQIAEGLPHSRLLWADHRTRGDSMQFVIGEGMTLFLVTVSRETWDCRITTLDIPRDLGVTGVFAHQDYLCVVQRPSLTILSRHFGAKQRTEEAHATIEHHRDRCFRCKKEGGWWVLAMLPSHHYHAILPSRYSCGRDILAMFYRDGEDGPIGISSEGDLYYTAAQQWEKIKHGLRPPIRVLAIARDGSRLIYGGEREIDGKQAMVRVYVSSKAVATVTGNPLVDAERLYVRQRTFRNQFNHIATDRESGTLVLRKSGRGEVAILLRSGVIRLASPLPAPISLGKHVPFVERPGHELGYSLKTASWADGSRAFLDSRGLLHLQSSDRSIPEATIVLVDGAASGWCSDGRMWGDAYFLGSEQPVPQSTIFDEVIAAFVKRLPC